MKILVFGGFLGAGKTTVIMQMIRYMVSIDPKVKSRVVLLENEIGNAGIDDKSVASTGLRVETLFSGCVCCTMAGEMIENIKYIDKKFSPEWIVLETTGMAYPSKIKENIRENFPELECRLLCLVDARRWNRLQKVPELRQFSAEQLYGADVVLINKCDLVSEEELEAVDASVREINDKPLLVHIVAKNEVCGDTWKKILEEKTFPVDHQEAMQ